MTKLNNIQIGALSISLVITGLCAFKILIDAPMPALYWEGLFSILLLWMDSPNYWGGK